MGPVLVAKQVSVLSGPLAILEAIELGARGGHQPESCAIGAVGQTAGDLLVELWPVAARDYADIGDVAETTENCGHLIVKGLLALGESAVKVKSYQSLHCGLWTAGLCETGERVLGGSRSQRLLGRKNPSSCIWPLPPGLQLQTQRHVRHQSVRVGVLRSALLYQLTPLREDAGWQLPGATSCQAGLAEGKA